MLQWREPALTAILTLKEKKTRFLFEKSSPNVLVSSVGIRIKNYIDFIKLEKFFTTKKRVCGRQKRSAALPRRALTMTIDQWVMQNNNPGRKLASADKSQNRGGPLNCA